MIFSLTEPLHYIKEYQKNTYFYAFEIFDYEIWSFALHDVPNYSSEDVNFFTEEYIKIY